MSVRVVSYRTGGWEVDIRVVLPDGSRRRERKKLTLSSKSGARRWAQARERELLTHGPAKTSKEVPTLELFVPRFLDGHARANQQKPSTIATKEVLLRAHLIPLLGAKRLYAITSEDVQRLKRTLSTKAPKTINNVLTVLNTLLKAAVEWQIIDRVPCTIRLLKVSKPSAAFHDFDTYEHLVESARVVGSNAALIVLLGGEAGLRCGEMIALEWADVDLAKRQLCVQRSSWSGHVTPPERGTAAIHSVDSPPRRGAPRAPASQECVGGVRRGWQGAEATQSPVVGAESRPAWTSQERWCACAPAHLLLAFGDAGGAGAGDSGACGAREHHDYAALHALEPRSHRRGHPAAGWAGWGRDGGGEEGGDR